MTFYFSLIDSFNVQTSFKILEATLTNITKQKESWKQKTENRNIFQVAMSAAQQLDDPAVWEKLSEIALQQGNHQASVDCFTSLIPITLILSLSSSHERLSTSVPISWENVTLDAVDDPCPWQCSSGTRERRTKF